MTNPAVSTVAEELREAYRTGTPVRPPSRSHDLSLDDAYAIQLDQVAAWNAAGATVIGHKIGLTSTPMRRALGVDEPDYGHLMSWMVEGSGATVAADRFLQPRVEPELAFVLDRDLSGVHVTVADVVRATAYVLPALEIIDSRIVDWQLTLVDTVADNASSGGVVLGARPRPLDALDLATTGVVLAHNGEVVQTGAGAAVMGHPANAVAWLARRLAAAGGGLEAGQTVLSGSITAAVPAAPGDHLECTFAGLGSVGVRFRRSDG